MFQKSRLYKVAGFLVFLVITIFSVSLIFIQMVNGGLMVSPIRVEKVPEIEFDKTIVYPGSTTKIIIKAAPSDLTQTVAIIRYEVTNAEIVSVTSLKNIAMGTCENGEMFTSNKICVDISDGTPLHEGENLLSVELKWGEDGNAYIKAGEDNGYYNGQYFVVEKVASYSVDQSTLPFTGENTDNTQNLQLINGIDNFVLIGSFLTIIVILVILKLSKKD